MFLVAIFSKKTHDIRIKKGRQLKNTAIGYLGADGIDDPSTTIL